MKNKNFILTSYYFLIILYLEMVFKLFMVDKFWRWSLLSMIIYLIAFSLVLNIVTSLFPKKINSILMSIIIAILSFWFSFELVFAKIFDVYFSIANFGLADQAFTFWRDALNYFFQYWYILLIMFIPLIITQIIKSKFNLEREARFKIIIMIILAIIAIGVFQLTLFINRKPAYSAQRLYYDISNNSLSIDNFGVISATFLEIKRAVFGFDEKTSNLVVIKKEEVEETPKKIIYNKSEIDFSVLAKNEKDEDLKAMHAYFANDSGTKKNDYTGYYEGKNLILVMAESFNSVAVSKEITPTLYKLTTESFVFENFYTPVMLSTLGGEFQELTGLYPSLLNSVWRKGNNYFPYGVGNVFNDLDYQIFAYHNNQYNFQSRDKYLAALGFNNYLGCYNGLEKRINCRQWPESDVEMIEATTSDFITNVPFMTYYVTVSGHMPYSWSNQMAKKNRAVVAHLEMSETAKAYIATQVELDRALELLIKQLEEHNQLANTVIALVGDHYPYDLDIDTMNEMSSYQRDDIIEINRSNFILWNSKTPRTVIKKIGAQVDVMPTILNLFGIEYDSRLLIGKDLLSDEPGLAIFNNRSWISDKGRYFSSTGEFIANQDIIVENNYVNIMNMVVSSKMTMSKLILEKDYYQKVLGG